MKLKLLIASLIFAVPLLAQEPTLANSNDIIAAKNRANHTGTQSWSTLTSTPTTLSGYGILDASHYDKTVTTLTTGGASALNAIPTVALSAGEVWSLASGTLFPAKVNYILVAGTDAEDLPHIVRPLDYAGGTNEKVWKRVNPMGNSLYLQPTPLSYVRLAADAVVGARTIQFPDASGTAAITSQADGTITTGDISDMGATGIAIGQSATPAAAKAAQKPMIGTIAAYGDSLMGGTIEGGSGTTLTAAGVLDVACAYLHHKPQIILRSSTDDTHFQVGGQGADWLNANVLPELIAAAPDAALMQTGQNNLATSRATHGSDLDAAANEIFGYITAGWDAVAAAGIIPIAATLTPDNFPTDTNYPPAGGSYHPDYRTIRSKVNELIRANAASHGALVFDGASLLQTNPDDSTSLCVDGYTTDDLHYSVSGFSILGKNFAQFLRENYSLTERSLLPHFASTRWITLNPGMTGDVSGVATSWTVSTNGAATVVKSKTADGFQRLEVSGGIPGNNTDYITLSQNIIVTDRSTDGKTFRAFVLLRQSGTNGIYARLLKGVIAGTGVTTTNAWGNQYATSSMIAALTKVCEPAESQLLKTPPLTVPVGTGTDQRQSNLVFYIYGSGTIDILAAGLLEEP